MTVMRVTGWFSQMFDTGVLAEGLQRAAVCLDGQAYLRHKDTKLPCTSEQIASMVNSQKRQYVCEIGWQIIGETGGPVRGKICWPTEPWDIPGTLEFDVVIKDVRGVQKTKSRVFFDAVSLLPLLGSLCNGVQARSLLVAPARLPAEFVDARYERFMRLGGHVDLANIDWIFGLRSTSEQAAKLDSARDLFAHVYDEGGFRLWAVSSSPIRYDSDLEMARLKRIEKFMGLAD